jgi:DNA-binding SARP family transcriptional activator
MTVSGPGYRVLGEIAVHGDTVTRRRERELLGLLVAARGRTVAVERIVDEIWGADAARSAVQVVVSRLRTLLDPTRSLPPTVETTPAGYRLVAKPGDVDVWTFEDLAERALSAPTPADRLVLGTRAEELWEGEPYAECQSVSLRAEATRLRDLRVTVQESRAEALLELGHPAAAVRLLAPVAPEHPYREQLLALLARAHYACSRQADALATLATLRSRLSDDLGVDPSTVVRAMEQAILAQDPGLDSKNRIVPSDRTLKPATGGSEHSGLSGSGIRSSHGTALCSHRRRSGTRYVLGHTPLVAVGATGTMTG